SALAYEVKEGEYIQVIDVQGRQCSDFLAFHRQKLEKGLERGMDGVTTRTLMGAAYPRPGLYSKFFDVDMDPLVRVVRVSRRHRPGQRVGVHGHPCADLPAREQLLYGRRPSRDPGGRASADK